MLTEFESWFKDNSARLSARNCIVKIERPSTDSDNNCAYADIETQNYMARATVWDSGEFQKEAINPDTGASALYEYKVLHKADELYAALESFVEWLSESMIVRAA